MARELPKVAMASGIWEYMTDKEEPIPWLQKPIEPASETEGAGSGETGHHHPGHSTGSATVVPHDELDTQELHEFSAGRTTLPTLARNSGTTSECQGEISEMAIAQIAPPDETIDSTVAGCQQLADRADRIRTMAQGATWDLQL